MYASAAVYFLGMSLALGSDWGLIPSVVTILGLVWRLFDEENISRSKSIRLFGILRQSALAPHTETFLTFVALSGSNDQD